MTGLTVLPCPRRRVARRWLTGLLVVLLTAMLPACSRSGDAGPALPLRFIADVALPGTPSRFDYQDVDPGRRRLYVAHLGGSRIDVVDLDSLRVVGTVEGVASVHGLRLAPDVGRLFASAPGTNEVLTIDAGSLAVLARAPTGAFPDGLAYDPVDAKVYVSDESGGDETVLDTAGHALGRVALGGEAGNVAYDPIYVAGESGVVAMFAIDGRDLRKLGQRRLAAKAHTVVVDPVTARVFFPLEDVKGHPVLRVMTPVSA